MTEQEIEMMARAAGLDNALAWFKDDLLAAARTADELRGAVAALPATPADEPWPAMRVEDRR
ncbi:MAG TPA: hypothetical protein VGB82_23400 [Alphaproteobacteria bacterium]